MLIPCRPPAIFFHHFMPIAGYFAFFACLFINHPRQDLAQAQARSCPAGKILPGRQRNINNLALARYLHGINQQD